MRLAARPRLLHLLNGRGRRAGQAGGETPQMRIGLYPGTFDPVTNGHTDIIARAAKLVDRVVIGVAKNDDKGPLFTTEERVEMLREAVSHIPGEIVVQPFSTLLMHFAEELHANVIIRGLRAVADFEYEFQMVGMNRALDASVETVFLMADAHHQAIASRLVKEIARLGGDVSRFVPARVTKALAERLGRADR